MHAFDVLGDPVRRRILELLAAGELASGAVVDIIAGEFGITQAAVSQHLKVLRESGFATVRPEGTRRLYALDPGILFDRIDVRLRPMRIGLSRDQQRQRGEDAAHHRTRLTKTPVSRRSDWKLGTAWIRSDKR